MKEWNRQDLESYREGKLIERWNQLDQMRLMQQLGVIPASAG